MTDAALRNRLLASVPALDDADWLDVRQRASAISARRRNRRLFAIAAALAVLTALVVNPALGIGERLLSFVEGDPAPESIKREFTLGEESPPPLRVGDRVIERPTAKRPPADLADAHLAVALESSLGSVYLWVDPMTGGGRCTLLEVVEAPKPPPGLPRGGVNCGSRPPADRPIAGGETGERVDGEYLHLTVGQVNRRIARLEVALTDGRVVPIRLVDGFFLAELPAGTLADRVPGCKEPEMPPSILPQRAPAPPPQDPSDVLCLVNVVEYRGFDATGRLVERYRVPKPEVTRPIEPFKKALTARLFSGQEIRIEYARAERNRLCFRLLWESGMAQGGCSVYPTRALPSATVIGSGKKQTFFLSGPVGSDVARLELVWDDGSTERLRIENGFSFKQIDPFGSRFPSKLVGRDEAGRVIVERSALGGPG
jgi:hypothetical protein